MMPVVLTVGTTHPLNIAGLGLTARLAASLGVRTVTVVAGISAQRADAVLALAPVAPALIDAQFAALRDARPAAVHVGALLDAASVGAVARGIAALGVPAVCDPVIATSGGDRLADDATIAALQTELFARCTLVTPNLDEAAILLGAPVADADRLDATARALVGSGIPAVLLKGGHLAGDAVDVLADSSNVTRFGAPRIAGDLRGTGDILAFAIAAELARGSELRVAIERARAVVRARIAERVAFAGASTIA